MIKNLLTIITYFFIIGNALFAWYHFVEIGFGNWDHIMPFITNAGVAFGLYFTFNMNLKQ